MFIGNSCSHDAGVKMWNKKIFNQCSVFRPEYVSPTETTEQPVKTSYPNMPVNTAREMPSTTIPPTEGKVK